MIIILVCLIVLEIQLIWKMVYDIMDMELILPQMQQQNPYLEYFFPIVCLTLLIRILLSPLVIVLHNPNSFIDQFWSSSWLGEIQ